MKSFFSNPLIKIYVLNALGKGQSVFFFVLLPVFYAQKLINSAQMGYIGALSIAFLIFGAIVVVRWLHNLETKLLIQLSGFLGITSATLLLVAVLIHSLPMIILAYALIGLVVGTAMSGVKAASSELTTKGDRYKSLAKLHMATDIVRITFPLIVSSAIVMGSVMLAIIIIIFASIVFFLMASSLPKLNQKVALPQGIDPSLRKNKDFLYTQIIEFLDSFSSSQLFVFLPLIFLSKGYSLESSLVLQSFIFIGYISGRWLVSVLAKKYSGMQAIALGEAGMVISIILLLITNNLLLLYALSFIVGIFARGTSPAIEALAFDTLSEHQSKKGTAFHIVSGDSGSALGQLLFGITVAAYGVNAPFIIAALVAALISFMCFSKEIKV